MVTVIKKCFQLFHQTVIQHNEITLFKNLVKSAQNRCLGFPAAKYFLCYCLAVYQSVFLNLIWRREGSEPPEYIIKDRVYSGLPQQ